MDSVGFRPTLYYLTTSVSRLATFDKDALCFISFLVEENIKKQDVTPGREKA